MVVPQVVELLLPMVQSTTNTWQQVLTTIQQLQDGFAFDDNGKLLIDMDAAGTGNNVIEKDATADDTVVSVSAGFTYLVFFEDADNTGTFSNVDDNDDANLEVKSPPQEEQQ